MYFDVERNISLNSIHESYMQRCLQLASMGHGNVAPNPLVGAVIVCDGKIVGEGYHKLFGGPHAEVEAINSCHPSFDFNKCILYVNLEPCSHFGKTPPCADLIIQKKIKHVVIGTRDPFSGVNGQGIKRLKDNGIDVVENILVEECKFLNRRFFTFHNKKRPYIILKWAVSKDGFIDRIRAGNDHQINRISGQISDVLVHQMRSEEMAILVGSTTVINDNPQLTTRLVHGKNAVRIVLDIEARIPLHSEVLNEASTSIVFANRKRDLGKHITEISLEPGREILPQVMEHLHKMNITSVIVEGGAQTLQTFIDAGTWDEAWLFRGNIKFNDGLRSPVMQCEPSIVTLSGEDQLEKYYNYS